MRNSTKMLLGLILTLNVILTGLITDRLLDVYQDFYQVQTYDLIKQGEKLKKDPSDLKKADVMKFQYICESERYNTYLQRNHPATKRVQVGELCTILDSIVVK